jgi:Phosphotransferase enzyme family
VLVGGEDLIMGVIDWEFAMLAPLGQDIGQLAAHLTHHIIVGQRAREYETFLTALMEAYGRGLQDGGQELFKKGGMGMGVFFRGARILYGRELINSTTWDRKCHCSEPQCRHDKEAVEKGVEAIITTDKDPLYFAENDFLGGIYAAFSS